MSIKVTTSIANRVSQMRRLSAVQFLSQRLGIEEARALILLKRIEFGFTGYINC